MDRSLNPVRQALGTEKSDRGEKDDASRNQECKQCFYHYDDAMWPTMRLPIDCSREVREPYQSVGSFRCSRTNKTLDYSGIRAARGTGAVRLSLAVQLGRNGVSCFGRSRLSLAQWLRWTEWGVHVMVPVLGLTERESFPSRTSRRRSPSRTRRHPFRSGRSSEPRLALASTSA